jgi:long-subunit fatty acid transport protein
MGYLIGVAYSMPEIALRAELTYQPQTKFATTTAFAPSAAVVCAQMAPLDCSDLANAGTYALTNDAITAAGAASVTNLSLPDTIAFNFQTGIAKDTLMTASYRKSSWGKAQINIAAPVAITTNFDDAVSYSLGIGRKFTDSLSGSITYSKEESTGSTSTSLFSVSDGSEAISIGLQYTQDNMAISGGISQRKVGNMTVDPGFEASSPLFGSTMNYSGNTVTAMGLKLSFSF